MDEIRLLDKETIDKIAAGEVIDRPSSVVKELCENSIDAGASSISVEIVDGGTKLIRITDNGKGIDQAFVKKAFLRHSTSKLSNAEDLHFIRTLGFRGEALSSIAAVSHTEILTKTTETLTGVIYKIDGGEETSLEEAGLPDGTTIIVRDLFYNTPARLKFLKSIRTEAGYITEIIEKLALSHPEISFKLKLNNMVKLMTNGSGNLKDVIYEIYGREIASNLTEVDFSNEILTVKGYIGKPVIARGNRAFENYFINGRYIKDRIIESAIEEAYKGFQMKGSFPFTVFNIYIEPEYIDVNVHPSKMEVRFYDNQIIYDIILRAVNDAVKAEENIPVVNLGKDPVFGKSNDKKYDSKEIPEPFEEKRTIEFIKKYAEKQTGNSRDLTGYPASGNSRTSSGAKKEFGGTVGIVSDAAEIRHNYNISGTEKDDDHKTSEQQTLFSPDFLSEKAKDRHRIIGQIFDTYWIVEYADKMYLIDQHAAHEKVIYEELMHNIKSGTHYSQNIAPALIISPDHIREEALIRFLSYFEKLGFVIEPFGKNDYAISAIPMDLFGLNDKNSFLLILDELSGIKGSFDPELLLDKTATAACKAAVKGGNRLTLAEAQTLIDKLLSLDNPYNCPHGRPTIITMTKYELERKFKRIV